MGCFLKLLLGRLQQQPLSFATVASPCQQLYTIAHHIQYGYMNGRYVLITAKQQRTPDTFSQPAPVLICLTALLSQVYKRLQSVLACYNATQASSLYIEQAQQHKYIATYPLLHIYIVKA